MFELKVHYSIIDFDTTDIWYDMILYILKDVGWDISDIGWGEIELSNWTS